MFQVSTRMKPSFETKRRKRRHDFRIYEGQVNEKMEEIFDRLNMQKCVWRRNGTRCLKVDETWRYIQGLDMKIPQNQYAIILLRLLELDIGKFASIKSKFVIFR